MKQESNPIESVDRVEIAPPRNHWPELFAREKERILHPLKDHFVAIEHFGSTSVPGLAAKPIVDMLGGLSDIQLADNLIQPLQKLGYNYEGTFTERLMFCRRNQQGERSHHLHLVAYQGHAWQQRLVFRDALRDNPEFRARYLSEKRHLAKQFSDDMNGYAKAKGAFISKYLNTL